MSPEGNLIQQLQTRHDHILQYPYFSTVRIIIPFCATKPRIFSLKFYEEEKENKGKEDNFICWLHGQNRNADFIFQSVASCADYSRKRLKIPNYQTLITASDRNEYQEHFLG
jgi:hypothetical protein